MIRNLTRIGAIIAVASLAALAGSRAAWPRVGRPQIQAASARGLSHASDANLAASPSEARELVFAEDRERILEQIETARLGLLAAQSSLPAPVQRTEGAVSPVALAGLAAALAVAGGSVIARGRKGWPRGRSDCSAEGATSHAVDARIEVLEASVCRLEESILQVVRAVECIASPQPNASDGAGGDSAADGQEPYERAVLAQAPDLVCRITRQDVFDAGDERQPTLEDPDYRRQAQAAFPIVPATPAAPLPIAPATADGRDLTRIRRAVLRLSDKGWSGERIGRELHLGPGDISLILKSAAARADRVAEIDAGCR